MTRREKTAAAITAAFFLAVVLSVILDRAPAPPRQASRETKPTPAPQQPSEEEKLRGAVSDAETALGREHPEVAARLLKLADFIASKDRPDEAARHLRRALSIEVGALGFAHPDTIRDRRALASLLHTAGQDDEAAEIVERLLGIVETTFGSDAPQVAATLRLKTEIFSKPFPTSTIPLMRRALKIDEAALGNEHPDVARDLQLLADALSNYNSSEAVPLAVRALAILEARLGQAHPDLILALQTLARLYMKTFRPAEAEPFARRALSLIEAQDGAAHPSSLDARKYLADILRQANHHSEAEDIFRSLLAAAEARPGHAPTEVADILTNLALCLRSSGKAAAAEPVLRRSLALYEEAFMRDFLWDSAPGCFVGYALAATGHPWHGFPILKDALRTHGAAQQETRHALNSNLHLLTEWLMNAQRFGDAEPLLRMQAPLARISFADTLALNNALDSLARILERRKQWAEAEPLRRESLANSIVEWRGRPGGSFSPLARSSFALNHVTQSAQAYRLLLSQMEKPAAGRVKMESVLRDYGLDDAMSKVVMELAGYR